jgi:hypothetical protein
MGGYTYTRIWRKRKKERKRKKKRKSFAFGSKKRRRSLMKRFVLALLMAVMVFGGVGVVAPTPTKAHWYYCYWWDVQTWTTRYDWGNVLTYSGRIECSRDGWANHDMTIYVSHRPVWSANFQFLEWATAEKECINNMQTWLAWQSHICTVERSVALFYNQGFAPGDTMKLQMVITSEHDGQYQTRADDAYINLQ